MAKANDTLSNMDELSPTIKAFISKFDEYENETDAQYEPPLYAFPQRLNSTQLRSQHPGDFDISSKSDSLSKKSRSSSGILEDNEGFNEPVRGNTPSDDHPRDKQSLSSAIRTSSSNPSSIDPRYGNLELVKRIGEFEPRTRVDLFKRQLTDQQIPIVVEEAMMNKQCIGLNLFDNQITAKGASVLADALRDNTTLVKLYLKDNCVMDTGVYHLAQSLSGHNSTLKRLSLYSNGITDVGAQYLADMLKQNRTLTELWLSDNEIGNEGVKALTDALAHHNTSLIQLVLSSNKSVTDSSVEYLMTMFKHNRTLVELWIDNCSLSEQGQVQLQQATKSKRRFTLYLQTDLSSA